MNLQTFLAFRYLFSRGKETLVWLITLVSVGGVAIGVGALIVVISVMEGLDKEILQRLLGVQSHAIIYNDPSSSKNPPTEEFLFCDYFIDLLEQSPEIIAATPTIAEQVLMQAGPGADARKRGVELRGLDIKRDGRVTDLTNNIVEGEADPGEDGVVVGLRLAKNLNLKVGDKIQCVTTRVRMAGFGYHPRRIALVVKGVFKSGIYEIDLNVAYMRIEEARRIFGLPQDACHDIRVRVRNPNDMADFDKTLGETLNGHSARFLTWQQYNPSFFFAVQLEKYAMFVILLLIVVVAAFNIIGTLVLVVSSKTREIGLLQAVGVSPRMIAGVFTRVGLILGGLGTLLGTILGLSICAAVKMWRFELAEEVYNVDHLPALVLPSRVAIIIGSSMLICLLASIVPAWRASKAPPR
jgi:lipoprotein-releasing system permease protein